MNRVRRQPKEMKHKQAHRILGRTVNHRTQLLRQLSRDLLRHGFLVTTEAKAKELRRYFEPLVTEARRNLTLPRRRRLLARLGSREHLEMLREAAQQTGRTGGYLRLVKLASRRSDGAGQVRVDMSGREPQD